MRTSWLSVEENFLSKNLFFPHFHFNSFRSLHQIKKPYFYFGFLKIKFYLMYLNKCHRNYRKVRKLLQIENFLCCFEIESSLPVAGLFIAVPCCILTYHDAVFLWEYMKERNEEEVRSGTRSPEGL